MKWNTFSVFILQYLSEVLNGNIVVKQELCVHASINLHLNKLEVVQCGVVQIRVVRECLVIGQFGEPINE